MANALLGSITLMEETCCNCFTHFAMDIELYRRHRANGGTFYCPNGHAQHYTETEVDKLKRQNQALQTQKTYAENRAERAAENYETERRSHIATKGQLTKTRRRIAHGVCPCCHRTFKQLAAHMGNKHPDFKEVYSGNK